jgi:hypothetical protein
MKITPSLLVPLALIVCSVAVLAQGPPPRHGPPPFDQPGKHRPEFGPPKGPGGPGFNFLSSEMRPDGKIVKGAPYSATIIVESTQTLGDGTRITRRMTASVNRDSEGRTRREQKFDNIGPFVPMGKPPHLIFINDVVAGAHYVINVDERIARKMTPPGGGGPPPKIPRSSTDESKTESLGKQMIEGVEAEGVRSTITIPAGQIGNDRPLEIVSERWDSPELQVTVMSRHSDPRVGETVYRLTNLSRAEQPRSLFEVPADYRLTEGGPPDGFGKPRGGPPRERRQRPEDF